MADFLTALSIWLIKTSYTNIKIWFQKDHYILI